MEVLAKEVRQRGDCLFFGADDMEQGARLRAMNEKREGGYADSDSSSEEEDIEEELGYFSPLDIVNPYETFKSALTS